MKSNVQETIRLVGLMLEQEISADQFQRLNDLLHQDVDARRVYIQSIHMDQQLPALVLQHYVDQSSVTRLPGRDSWHLRWAIGLVVLAATVLIMVGWQAFTTTDDHSLGPPFLTAAEGEETLETIDPNVAVVTAAIDVDWADNQSFSPGDGAAPGVIKIESGVLRLEFYCGAAVLLEGPAEFELISSTVAVLSAGRLRAHVPPEARGFTILAPQVKLVDQGTEFGVVALDSGATQVHVFDGLVELYPGADARHPDRSPVLSLDGSAQQLSTGQGVMLSADGKQQVIAVKTDDFVSFRQFSQMVADATQQRHQTWLQWKHSFRKDPRIYAWFDFDPDRISLRRIHGLTPESDPLGGTLVGCRKADGRWPGESSLEFKHPGDRVRVFLPGELEAMTAMAWVRIDSLDRPFNGLLMSDASGPGRPHWQINKRGQMILSIRDRQGPENYKSAPVIDELMLGRWIHLATVYDPDQGFVKHYINGDLAGNHSILRPVTFHFGNTEIGNWRNLRETTRTPIRVLNGRVDELILFRTAVSADEIRRIHEFGSPEPR